MSVYDVTVIGGGPVGLFGATMARLHGLSAKIIESLPELGGQLYALYPEKPIYDVAGFPSITAKDLAGELIRQAERFRPTIALEESVQSIEAAETDPLLYRLVTNKGEHETRCVLITVGIGAFVPRVLPVVDAARWVDHGVYYFVPRLDTFTGQEVVVVGGGDTAVDWTLAVAPHAKKVTVVHRRREFRAQEESIRVMRETPHIRVVTPAELTSVQGDARPSSVTITYTDTHATEDIPATSIISGLGFLPSLGPVKNWGLTLDRNTIRVSLSDMATNLPGVYAAGDVVSYDGKVKLIATGFGEIGMAIAKIRSYLDPSKKGLPHSTNLKGL